MEVQERLEEERDSSEYDSEEEARRLQTFCLLGVKGRTGNCSSKEPGDEAIHGIVGVSRWATSAG